MKPIQTSYKGYRFRSRTEARWAVFFDAIGFRWEFEAQGYVLPDGTCYLPDFKLLFPDDTVVFCEVKPEEFDDFCPEELSKLRQLSDEVSCSVVLLTGTPAYRVYHQILPSTPVNTLTNVLFRDHHPYIQIVDGWNLQYLRFDEGTGRMHFQMDECQLANEFGADYVKAVEAARSARFEHGESPKPRAMHSELPRAQAREPMKPRINPKCYRCGREIVEKEVAVFSKAPAYPVKADAPERSYGLVGGALAFSFCMRCAKLIPRFGDVWQVNA
jgi:hypothetical protein